MDRRERFGPFILERLLGRGGMGAVYRAQHEETGRTVAVKTLLTPLESERERFEAEISTLKLLRHENIVKLYGFGQEDGVLYYAMEYVDAPSLATLMKRGRRFSWEEVVYIGAAVCRALKHAHDRGVIHRDVKPANILLLDGGGVKVADYGIAQYFGSSRLTGANQVVGTIEYMAPEQAQAGPITPRTDAYALGALMYALLTGEPPYRARSLPELLRRHREETPESIRRTRPEAPNVLDAFLRELLQIAPEKRPGDARLIGRRLEGVLKTAANVENGNPFLNRRFFIDGRSTDDGEDEASDAPTPSRKLDESLVDAAPDLPYRSFDDERFEDDVKSPFERTTEFALAEAASDDLFGETADGERKNETTSTSATADDADFDLATVAADDANFASATVAANWPTRNEREEEPAAIAFENGCGGAASDFQASTEVGGADIREAETEENAFRLGAERTFDDEEDEEIVEASSLEKFKKSRFVPVDEGELDALPTRAEKATLWAVGQVAVLCAALLGIVLFFCYVFQTPTADALCERIENELRVSDESFLVALARVEGDLRKMVESYPDDPRAATARGYLERLEAEAAERRLERRLERRRREGAAGPFERAYFDALRVAENDPETGVAKLEAFVALLETETTRTDDGALERDFVEAFLGVARRKREKLVAEREKARVDDLAFIAERWSAAVALAETKPGRAEKIRVALLALYGDRDWADEALAEAKATDWSVSAETGKKTSVSATNDE
ncbi:MAG: serine/threonine protein kinase [Thermoguttaceae bacterium]|nr:serine/threonine protein kinase [Thermoguttaceae bacterium]